MKLTDQSTFVLIQEHLLRGRETGLLFVSFFINRKTLHFLWITGKRKYWGQGVMRTQDERIALLHKRAAEIERGRNRSRAACWGGISACLCILLIAVLYYSEIIFHNAADMQMNGSSLLGESAGGYILAAVIAFFAGVIITVVCYRKHHK